MWDGNSICLVSKKKVLDYNESMTSGSNKLDVLL